MEKILITGDINSIHLQRFTQNILNIYNEKDIKIDILNISNKDNIDENELLQYYRKNNIEIINPKHSNLNIYYLRVLYNLYYKIKSLKPYIKKHYDYVYVNFCDINSMIILNYYAKYFKKIILIFWGSDLLRNKYADSFIYNHIYKISYKIILLNENSYIYFNEKTKNKYKTKTYNIMFPSGICEKMNEIGTQMTDIDLKKKWNLPIDKKIVLCGHSGTPAEQYKSIIQELNKLDERLRNNYYFVFMMTYGDKRYIENITQILSKSNFNYKILVDYIPFEEMITLHFASDIHITGIKTDAFSSFLQEELLSGNIVIYGKWLNYYELEKEKSFAISYDKFSKIPCILKDIDKNYTVYKNNCLKNISFMWNIQSNDVIEKKYKKYILNDI